MSQPDHATCAAEKNLLNNEIIVYKSINYMYDWTMGVCMGISMWISMWEQVDRDVDVGKGLKKQVHKQPGNNF